MTGLTRRLTVEDAPSCASLRKEALADSPEAFASTYQEEVTDGDFMGKVQQRLLCRDAVTFGSFYEDQLVGTVMVWKKSIQKMRHKADIEAMYVTKRYRGSGVGRALMQAVFAQARIWDLEQLQLAVVSSNQEAKAFYHSFGFQTYGVEKAALKHNGVYWDEEYMTLFL
ncbi:GNAT family N-acetyltransferase [Salibacterium aidingense]|uniref:GNAT family N-acetyltransferase n=1 Tax=Salibacterium aidingense TaxID=384933 RepID=UPI003BE870B5